MLRNVVRPDGSFTGFVEFVVFGAMEVVGADVDELAGTELDDITEEDDELIVVGAAVVVVVEFSAPYIKGSISMITRISSRMLPNQSECCISGNV